MSTVNFMGSYSGIDQTMIDQLMAIEKRPLIQLSEKKTSLESEKNAWNDVRTRLSSLFDKIKVLKSEETYTSKTATTGVGANLSVSKNSPEGAFKIAVRQLATNTSVIGGKFLAEGQDATAPLNLAGKFVLNGKEVAVGAEDTIQMVADKINSFSGDTKVKATVIDSRLTLNHTETGNQAITLSDVEGEAVLENLGLGTTKSTSLGKNALFSVNGVEIEKTSNSVKDVIAYTTINLVKEHAAGESDTLVVKTDTAKTTKAVEDFVAQYNSTLQFISDKLAPGTVGESGTRGALAGDGALMRLQSSLRTMVTSTVTNGNTSLKDMSQLGVTTVDKFGQLKFDSTKLTDALSKNAADVKNFFASTDGEGKEVGFVSRINGYIDSFASTSGSIKEKTDSYERTLKDITKQVDSFNLRMERKEKYYITMFSKLDTAMMQAESQMSWLTSQISGLTGSTSKK